MGIRKDCPGDCLTSRRKASSGAASELRETAASLSQVNQLVGDNYLGGRIDSSELLPELTRCLT